MSILLCIEVHQIATCIPHFLRSASKVPCVQLHAWVAVHSLTKARPTFSGKKSELDNMLHMLLSRWLLGVPTVIHRIFYYIVLVTNLWNVSWHVLKQTLETLYAFSQLNCLSLAVLQEDFQIVVLTIQAKGHSSSPLQGFGQKGRWQSFTNSFFLNLTIKGKRIKIGTVLHCATVNTCPLSIENAKVFFPL